MVDDTTFTVELAAPRADFPVALSYSVFVPLPESFFDDPDAFGDNPVGNGPYKIAEDGWVHGESLKLVPNESHNGPRKARRTPASSCTPRRTRRTPTCCRTTST
ncbi:MAG: ABC transporter substrate-binding protein [Schumannella sp.]